MCSLITLFSISITQEFKLIGPCSAIGGGAQPSQTCLGIAETGSSRFGMELAECAGQCSAFGGTASAFTGSEVRRDPNMVSVNLLGIQLQMCLALVMFCQSSEPRS